MSNLYQRKGVWYACAQINGQQIRKSLRTTNKTQAKTALHNKLKFAQKP